MERTLRNQILLFLTIITVFTVQAQVGIGTTSPQAGSILDVVSTDKGILLPKVNITNLNTIAPITGGATEGLLVYNTNASTGVGFHYWSGTVWIPFNSKDWKE